MVALRPTSSTDEGPFYRVGAPFRDSIADGVDGEPLIVTGRVVAAPNRAPLAVAVLEVWQADSQGRYDVSLGPEAVAAWRLRGRLRTSTDGGFRLRTIRPGPYRVAGGMRPAHIHVIVTAPGRPALATELFFEGDPYLDEDAAGHVAEDLIHTVKRKDGISWIEHEFVLSS